MNIIKKAIKITSVGAATTLGTFFLLTRKSQFVPFTTSDPIFSSTSYLKFNPNRNPTTHDLCIRRVPLSEIKPELLEKEGKLVEAFCAGVWSGSGYAFQRAYLARKYQGPNTSHQLWSPSELKSSSYELGTQITDHFEVVDKTPERIVVRCGDSPLKRDVRPSDGLFEIGATINKEEGVAEFTLKSVFYQGLGKAKSEPMPPHIVWLHQQYTKLWMETAVTNTTR